MTIPGNSRKIKDLLKLPVIEFITEMSSFKNQRDNAWNIRKKEYIRELTPWSILVGDHPGSIFRLKFPGDQESFHTLLVSSRDLIVGIRISYINSSVESIVFPKKGSALASLDLGDRDDKDIVQEMVDNFLLEVLKTVK
jgi:hypothetical protein